MTRRIPTFHACIVCDLVRPEMHGKLAILGFLGVCPTAEVKVQHLDQPALLTFVIVGGDGEGSFDFTLDLVDESNGQKIATGLFPAAVANVGKPTTVVTQLIPTFGHAGDFSIRVVIDGLERYRGRLGVARGLA